MDDDVGVADPFSLRQWRIVQKYQLKSDIVGEGDMYTKT